MLNKNMKKLAAAVCIALLIAAGYAARFAFAGAVAPGQPGDAVIGKDIHLSFSGEEGTAAYLEGLLQEEAEKAEDTDPNEKICLLDENAVRKLISYMEENSLRIADGEYVVPQTGDFEEVIGMLRFEEE